MLDAGWREWVYLPDLSDAPIRAKLDTGARTSALHAFRMRRFKRDGDEWVSFELHPNQRSRKNLQIVEAPVEDERLVRSSNGSEEVRPVINAHCKLGEMTWSIELTLTRRDSMSYRLLLGRTALRGRIKVDSGRSFIFGIPETR